MRPGSSTDSGVHAACVPDRTATHRPPAVTCSRRTTQPAGRRPAGAKRPYKDRERRAWLSRLAEPRPANTAGGTGTDPALPRSSKARPGTAFAGRSDPCRTAHRALADASRHRRPLPRARKGIRHPKTREPLSGRHWLPSGKGGRMCPEPWLFGRRLETDTPSGRVTSVHGWESTRPPPGEASP